MAAPTWQGDGRSEVNKVLGEREVRGDAAWNYGIYLLLAFSSTGNEYIPDTKHLGIVDDAVGRACVHCVVTVVVGTMSEKSHAKIARKSKNKIIDVGHVPPSCYGTSGTHDHSTATSSLEAVGSFSFACLARDDYDGLQPSHHSNSNARAGGGSERARAPAVPVPRARQPPSLALCVHFTHLAQTCIHL